MLLTTLPQKSIFKVVNSTKDCKMASAKYITKTCVICGKEYQGIPQSLYCSKECHSQELLRRWHVKHPKPVLKRVCLVCGKEFVAESQNQQTCSLECRKIRYNEDWKRSFHNRMADHSKKERRRNLAHLDYLEHKEEKQSKKHGRLIQKKRELAQSLQIEPVIENNNGNIKQDYIEVAVQSQDRNKPYEGQEPQDELHNEPDTDFDRECNQRWVEKIFEKWQTQKPKANIIGSEEKYISRYRYVWPKIVFHGR